MLCCRYSAFLKWMLTKCLSFGSAAEETRAQRGGHYLWEEGERHQLQSENCQGGVEREGGFHNPTSANTY